MKYAKKLLVCLLTSIMLFVCPVLAQAETNLSVWANLVNVQINGENKPVRNVLYDGTTYIALRDVSELLGCTVDWVSETRTAVINTQKGAESTKTFEPLPEATETVISVYADYVNVEIDGAKKDVRNFLSDGTTYIALRDVSELLGCTVDWVSETRTAVITTQSASVNPIVMTVNGIPVDKNTFLVAAAEVETAQQYLTDEDFINAAISQVVYKTVIRQQAESVMPNIAEDAKEAAQTELLRLFLNY